ncbi:C1 family peptidase [Maledivibacter halophilus]|uniref:Aminopeptidase n=1 Tax=Maledivibacter halophilus TaxID=36842 RepID=A0A1T5KQI3_9FIRM|nr:C1 family peptidase [Maledivibacter halophilus]SKC65745.1 aminopeptidase C. Cysteine peptidase. MEROPS family C01B [Maledivibacter halophilus]
MHKKKSINEDLIKRASKYYHSDKHNEVYSDAIIENGLIKTALRRKSIQNMHFDFSDEIDVGRVTAQMKTGRCWMFASLNSMRYGISQNLNMKEKDFELSQSYLFFWDKFEKSNLFLENIIETIDKELDDYEVVGLLKNPIFDAGQWDMFAKLVEKYGIVPKYVMPEAYCCTDSKVFNAILSEKLRGNAKILRDMYGDGKSIEEIQLKKEELLVDMYNIIAHFLGEPPRVFDFEYRDKDNEFHRDGNITPLEFYHKYSTVKTEDYISIVNYPTKDKPFGKTYTVKFLGSVVDENPIKYLNLDIQTLRELAIKQIKGGEQVCFGCDVAKMAKRDIGILDADMYNYDIVLNTEFNLNKADRLAYRGSTLTHVMTLTGVNLVDGKPNRWKIQNSWGEVDGNKGFFIMSDDWFDEYVYKVIINKKYVPEDIVKDYEQKPILLKPYDPVGSMY